MDSNGAALELHAEEFARTNITSLISLYGLVASLSRVGNKVCGKKLADLLRINSTLY